MPNRKLAIEPGGVRRLEIDWSLFSRKRTIILDGYVIGEITYGELRKGKTIALPDGSSLKVHQTSKWGVAELQVTRNGAYLPDSDSDPQHRLERTVAVIFWIAGLNIAAGVLFFITLDTRYSYKYDYGLFDVIGFVLTGLIYGGLGFFVRRQSMIALVITVIGFVIDSLGFLALGVLPVYMLGRLILLLYIVRGFSAIYDLKRAESAPARVPKSTTAKSEAQLQDARYQSFLDEITLDPVPGKKAEKTKATEPVSRQELAILSVIGVLIVLVIAVGLGVVISRRAQPAPVVAMLPTIAPTETPYRSEATATAPLPPTWTPTPFVGIFPIDGLTLQLNVSDQAPTTPLNLADQPADKPYYPGDLAWNKPTYANNFYRDSYPSRATSGIRVNVLRGWESADSTGSWLYVDLGEPKVIHQIITIHFVDSNFSKSPQYYYLASNDLKTWGVIADETDTNNATLRYQPRIINLTHDITARYIGIYAANWSGGWGSVDLFAVFPPEYEYTLDDLTALHPE